MSQKLKIGITFAAFLMMLFLSLGADSAGTGVNEEKIENITKIVSPAVVRVEARNGTIKIATGVVLDKDGNIVTTALITPRDEEITVVTSGGKRIKADFLGMDMETRIAVVRAREKNLVPLSMGKSGELAPGTWIGVISLSPENTPAVTQGIVSSVSEDKLRLNVWVVPGMSGSPVVNKEGRMVGLLRGSYIEDKPIVFEFREKELVGSGYVFSKAEAPSSGMAVAIPADIVLSITTDIIKKGKVERGWLGVSITETKEGRVEIVEVQEKSPADLAELKKGDIVLKVDGKDILSPAVLTSEIRKRKPGQNIVLNIERNGKTMDIRVKLGEYTEEDAKRELELRFPRIFPSLPKIKSPEMPKLSDLPDLKPYRWAWEKRKYIGVGLEELNKELAEYFGLKEGSGLLVKSVSAASPAEKAGLKVGDVIFKADGRRIETVSELSALIQDKKKGEKIKIEFLRGKKRMSLDIEIEEEERGWGSFFENWKDFPDLLQEQRIKSNEPFSREIEQFNKKSMEKLLKLNEELALKNREYLNKSNDLAKKYGSFFRGIWIYYRI
ncbi:MAG: PDZ domain-containing protein [Candidatus Aminicenantales bacterium]